MLYAHGPDLCLDLDLRYAMANCFEALMGQLDLWAISQVAFIMTHAVRLFQVCSLFFQCNFDVDVVDQSISVWSVWRAEFSSLQGLCFWMVESMLLTKSMVKLFLRMNRIYCTSGQIFHDIRCRSVHYVDHLVVLFIIQIILPIYSIFKTDFH